MTADAFSLVRSAVIDRRYRNSFQVGCRHASIAQMKQLLLLAICLTISVPAFAQSVSVKDGNIQFTDKSGKTTAITSSGRDSNPLLAPDGKWVAFVRTVDGKKIATGSEQVEPTELWQVRVDGKEPSLLVRCRDSDKMESVIGGFENLQFSTNGKLLYFVTPAWATSGAVHVVDTTNGKERYLFPGNNLKVVPAGEYKDCLLVQQHRYFVGAGSYDWYWLLRPDGKEVGPVGEDTSNFEATYGNE
jgi:dipeptidyl aminopeptidase/acylaminoacyl peptidase